MARRVYKSNTNTDHVMSSSQSIHETVEGSHEYKIEGYSLAKGMGVGKYMSSGKFTVGGHVWAVLFNPDANTEDSKDYVSVYLELVNPAEQEVRALYEFSLLDQSGKNKYGVHVSPTTPTTFKTESPIWGCTEFMERSDFETSSYLKDDCLTIHYMSQNLKGLLESGIGSDITVVVLRLR
ncbi:BTB/POZ and MATH domain-containing protein 5-like [Papaver somniferum]|uniref:BTB/POZ and MATH domain-containing protein 5-like n=1 Tax=Papaver somniferum TaxID=3469 RepID=UPI000E6F49F4|nr:BTB/POZ and MATH domain-containing protein 5-like [Papaver somniferum]